jgi:Sec-independent protein translocase protein TatA
MELFGVGLPELFFIVIIALIVLGPKDMAATGKKMGTWLRKLVMSPGWRTFQDTSREIRNLPNRLMREAGVDEIEAGSREIKQQLRTALPREDERFKAGLPTRSASIENRIAPSIPDTTVAPENKDVETP